MFQTKVVEKIKTRILWSITFFSENRVVYEITCKNIVESDRPQMTWRMSIACWITKATNTQSEYVIIIAFPLQQWLHECASMLRYKFTALLLLFASMDKGDEDGGFPSQVGPTHNAKFTAALYRQFIVHKYTLLIHWWLSNVWLHNVDGKMAINEGAERMFNEATAAFSTILSQHFPRWHEQIHEPGYDSQHTGLKSKRQRLPPSKSLLYYYSWSLL